MLDDVLFQGFTQDSRYIIMEFEFPHGIDIATTYKLVITASYSVDTLQFDGRATNQEFAVLVGCVAQVEQAARVTSQGAWTLCGKLWIEAALDGREQLR